jgi:hypothetical protein
MEICEWCYCLTWSYQIHMCEVVDSIRMGTSNVGHVDAKLDPNSLKRKSKTIWFTRSNIINYVHMTISD